MKWLTENAIWLFFSLVIIIAVTHSKNAEAETNVFIGAWSTHLFSNNDLNEEHRLFAVEHNGWFAGTFTNSYNRESYAVAHQFQWGHDDLRAGVYVGAVRGYTKCWGQDDSNTDTCPLFVPYITYDSSVAPQIMLIGKALALSIKIRL